MSDAPEPRRTALAAEHAALGATMTDFGGWQMPLKYGSELAEHRAVRETAGLFDLSHMGEVWIAGPEAGRLLNTALVGDLAALAVGRAKYTLMCDDSGGIVDDLIVYRLGEERFLVVPNAGNAAVVAAALATAADGLDATVDDATARTSLIAVQGPAAQAVLAPLVADTQRSVVEGLRYYAIAEAEVGGLPALVARTGYTGEDGFELYVDNADAAALWRALLAAGVPHGLVPAGLAARDSLRLEAGMPLYGNELGLDVTPFEAGLGGVVSFAKPEPFAGRAALEAAAAAAPSRVLVGLRGSGRRAGRAGYAVTAGGREVGRITSGLPSPTLGHPIALAYVTPDVATPGTSLDVDLRGKLEAAEVVEPPFVRRPRPATRSTSTRDTAPTGNIAPTGNTAQTRDTTTPATDSAHGQHDTKERS